MNAVIETRGLQKRFGRLQALDGLNLRVEAGEIHGFLGPNGSGKSTTIRVLLGLMRASGGVARVFGRNPWSDAAVLHRRMAYVPGDVTLWPNLTGGEAIDLLTRLRGGTLTPAARARRRQLLDDFNLDPGLNGRVYSKGDRQKVAIIAALMVPADLYVLDEPTSGLDPILAAVFRRELQTAVAVGAAALLSSHMVSDVEQVCTRVSIIRAGRTVETGSLPELRHLTRTAIEFSSLGLAERSIRDLERELPDAHDFVSTGGRVTFSTHSASLPGVLPLLADLHVDGLRIAPPSLQDLFLRHYHEDLAGDGSPAPPGDGRPHATGIMTRDGLPVIAPQDSRPVRGRQARRGAQAAGAAQNPRPATLDAGGQQQQQQPPPAQGYVPSRDNGDFRP